MLDYLHKAEEELPELLKDIARWETKLVTYEKPMVERLWMQDGENRIFLHRIHPVKTEEGERPFLHAHLWPSAVKILEGRYEMQFGYHDYERRLFPPLKTILTAGSEYEMLDPDMIHSVSPIQKPSLSLMVTGPLYGYIGGVKPSVNTIDKVLNPELSFQKAHNLLLDFQRLYPSKENNDK